MTIHITEIRCGIEVSPPHFTTLLSIDDSVGGKALFECEDGYVIDKGDTSITCDELGRWSTVNLKCISREL